MGEKREMLRVIGDRLGVKLQLEAEPPLCRIIFNAASEQYAKLQITDLPAVGYLWAGWLPESPPESGPHIQTHGEMKFLVMVFAASGTDPTDPGPALDLLDAVEDALVDFNVDWGTGNGNLYLVEERTEEVDGMTVILSAVFGMDVVKVAA